MALYVKLGGTLLGLLTIGILTLTRTSDNSLLATLTGAGPTRSDVAQINEPSDEAQVETTGSLSETALREAARRRLALALTPQNAGGQTPLGQTALGQATVGQASLNPAGQTPTWQIPSVMAVIESPDQTNAPPVADIPADADQPRRLAERAEQALSQGDITGARLFLERATAATDGNGKALFMLAQTYDPRALSRMKVRGLIGNPELARSYYGKALAAGIGEARDRLTALTQ
jgi:hypothetical protein